MKILAIDTANYVCSATVWQDGCSLAHYAEHMERGHSEALLPAVKLVMAESCAKYSQLNAIAVTTGPGSFTGVRVGLAVARAIGLASNIPAIGILSTKVIAAQVNNESKIPIAVVLDARRSEIYMQLFSPEGTPINAPFCLTPKVGGEILNSSIWLVCGNGTELIRPHLSNNQSIIHVSNTHTGVLAELAAQADKNQQPPSPVYVRPPDAVLPKNAGRLRL